MSFADLNMTVSPGDMAIPKRRLQTFTIHHNATVDRYTVRDDRAHGRAGRIGLCDRGRRSRGL